jgi:hypothetical protein
MLPLSKFCALQKSIRDERSNAHIKRHKLIKSFLYNIVKVTVVLQKVEALMQSAIVMDVTTCMSFLHYVIIRSLGRGLHGSRVQVDEHSTYILRCSLTPGSPFKLQKLMSVHDMTERLRAGLAVTFRHLFVLSDKTVSDIFR